MDRKFRNFKVRKRLKSKLSRNGILVGRYSVSWAIEDEIQETKGGLG